MIIIKILCIDQPLCFRMKNLIIYSRILIPTICVRESSISVDKQKINFIHAHFILMSSFIFKRTLAYQFA